MVPSCYHQSEVLSWEQSSSLSSLLEATEARSTLRAGPGTQQSMSLSRGHYISLKSVPDQVKDKLCNFCFSAFDKVVSLVRPIKRSRTTNPLCRGGRREEAFVAEALLQTNQLCLWKAVLPSLTLAHGHCQGRVCSWLRGKCLKLFRIMHYESHPNGNMCSFLFRIN